jgi:hypothetical protein
MSNSSGCNGLAYTWNTKSATGGLTRCRFMMPRTGPFF